MSTESFNIDNLIFYILFDMLIMRSNTIFINKAQKPLYCEYSGFLFHPLRLRMSGLEATYY